MGDIIKPTMNHNPSQVANIPLTYLDTPNKLITLKGCIFTPAVFLSSHQLYFIVVTPRWPYIPQKGWYNVPDKGYLTWISDFKLVAYSAASIAGYRCWVFDAIEGNPPVEAIAGPNAGKGGLQF